MLNTNLSRAIDRVHRIEGKFNQSRARPRIRAHFFQHLQPAIVDVQDKVAEIIEKTPGWAFVKDMSYSEGNAPYPSYGFNMMFKLPTGKVVSPLYEAVAVPIVGASGTVKYVTTSHLDVIPEYASMAFNDVLNRI